MLLPLQGVFVLQERKPARRPGGFAIRRKKMFDLLKPGDL